MFFPANDQRFPSSRLVADTELSPSVTAGKWGVQKSEEGFSLSCSDVGTCLLDIFHHIIGINHYLDSCLENMAFKIPFYRFIVGIFPWSREGEPDSHYSHVVDVKTVAQRYECLI